MTITDYYEVITIGGVDVSQYVFKYAATDGIQERIDQCKISFSPAIFDTTAVLTPGSEVTVQRGTSSSDLIYIFRGYIVSNEPDNDIVNVACYNKLWLLKQRQATVSFDKNIDTEAGVISEIIKTLITTYGGLNADSSSIQNSGTTITLNKYLCVNDEVFERIMKLVDALGWQLYYDPVTDKVYCEEFGFRTYDGSITFGLTESNIQLIELPKLVYNYETLINKITINGAKQLDTKTQTFSGTGSQTTFTLAYTPQETEVDISGTKQNRGIKSGDTTTFDYWVEEDMKTINFVTAPPNATDNITVVYSAMVPIPVELDDPVSIELYSPTNPTTGDKTPFHKTLTFTDIIDVDDAINRGKEILDRFSTPYVSYTVKVSKSNKVFFPGQKVTILDDINGFSGELVVEEVVRQFPEPNDIIRFSDTRNFRNELNRIEERVSKIEKETLRNIETLFTVKQITPRSLKSENMYTKVQFADLTGNTVLIWDNPVYGLWDEFNWSDGSDPFTTTTIRLIPGNGSYNEYFYSTEFVDEANSTATIDTANWRVKDTATGGGFLLPTIVQSEAVFGNNSTITGFSFTIRYTGGSLQFYYGTSSSPTTPPTSWTQVTGFSSGIERTISGLSGNSWLYYRIVKDFNTIIQGVSDDFGRYYEPALQIRNIMES